jgi:hypothetical protein
MFPIEHHPSPRQLTVFGLLWLVFLTVWGAIAWWKIGSPWAAGVCWGLAVLVPALGLVSPGLLRIVYLVLTPIGLVLRLCGYDPMQRRFDREAKTYWVPREEEAKMDHVFRQF